MADSDIINEMFSIDFGGKQVPVWSYDGLYYVTLSSRILRLIHNQLFDFPNLAPNKSWISGATPEIAISAATYNSNAKKINRADKTIRSLLLKVKNLEEELIKAKSASSGYNGPDWKDIKRVAQEAYWEMHK